MSWLGYGAPAPDITLLPYTREPWLDMGRFSYRDYLCQPSAAQCAASAAWGPPAPANPCTGVWVGGKACCAECADGKACASEGVKAVTVGRSTPTDKIAELEANIAKLKADVVQHQPAAGDADELASWATVNHAVNVLVLHWGQFKTAQRDDWWWGDDDEAAFSALGTEYNQDRDAFLKYTAGQTTAPPVDVKPPNPNDPKTPGAGQQVLDTVKAMWWVAFIAGGAYLLLPSLLPRLLAAARK